MNKENGELEAARKALEELGSLKEQYACGIISMVEYTDRFFEQKNFLVYWIESIQIRAFQAE